EPGRGEAAGALFTAVRGRGAFARPLHGDGAPVPIRVSAKGDPATARFCEPVESAHSDRGGTAAIAAARGSAAEAIRLDSQAKYAVVGRGEAEIYLRMPIRTDYREAIWDHAAGALIVREAGGSVTDIDGKPLEFTHGRRLDVNRGLVVTNGPLHARVIEAI